jgi:hypothetical protein
MHSQASSVSWSPSSKGKGAYTCFPRILPVLCLGLVHCTWFGIQALLRLVLPNQGGEVDLEMIFRIFRSVLRELRAKALNEHRRGRLVPRVGRCSSQVELEVIGCAWDLAQWIESIGIGLGNLLGERTVLRSAQQRHGVFPDIILESHQPQNRRARASKRNSRAI